MVARKDELIKLQDRIAAATGRDDDLDRLIGRVLDDPPGAVDAINYTGSVDACIALIGRVLPHWHWHVGHGPSGILPYAVLTEDGDAGRRFEASSCTVPLALLGAVAAAKRAERPRRNARRRSGYSRG